MENHVSLNPDALQDDKNFILKMKKKSGLSGDPDTSKPCRPPTYEKSTEWQLPVEEGISGFKRPQFLPEILFQNIDFFSLQPSSFLSWNLS